MTCIVAVKHKNKVYIGGDSLGTDSGFGRSVRKDEKVFSKHDMIFGFCGSYRMGQILRYSFDIPSRTEDSDDMEYLVGQFIPALMDCYEDNGWYKKADEDEATGGEFIIGYNGNIYMIESDFQVGIPSLDYECCGAGADIARGALFVLDKTKNTLSPDKKITMALDAASEHSASVYKPYKILSI